MAKGPSDKSKSGSGSQGATTGFESELWHMAGTLRGSMDASEYKRVVMGLIFLIDVKRWKLVFETAILVERTKRSASRATMEA